MVPGEEAIRGVEEIRVKIFIEKKARKHIVTNRMIPVWERMGHVIRGKPKGCDVQLSFIRIREKEKRTGLPKVVRIDGVYYDLDTVYGDRNRSISAAHSQADGIIYQSKTAEIMSRKYLEPRKEGSISTVIYNGIEMGWCGGHVGHEGFNIIVLAKWRRHKRLKETIDVFLYCLPSMPDAKLHIFGMMHNNKKVKHPGIRYYGMVKREALKDVFARSDLSIHLSKKDACPNSVVEAIGAGVPVVTTRACGGAAEMCGMTPGCIVCKREKESYKPCYPYRDDYNKLDKVLKNELDKAIFQVYNDRRRVALPKRLRIKHMAEKYIVFMRKVCR